jgi:hypothetical protein
MKSKILLCGTFFLTSLAAHAGVITESTGTPGNAYTLPVTPVSPNLHGTTVNFDTAALENPTATCVVSGCPSLTLSGLTFSSPDMIQVIPFSTQSGPDELYDLGANGIANLIISLTGGVTEIGVGIADSDGVTVTIEALGLGNAVLQSFPVTIPQAGSNPGNGYFLISDTTPGLYGLEIVQSSGNANFSGLAIDDVQVTPEPSSYLLLVSGAALLVALRKRARA